MALQAVQERQDERDILVMEDIDPAAQFGSQRLIAAHLGGAPVDIKSWGTAETVYEEVTAKLIAYGVEQGIAQNFVRGLVEYAVEKASEFQSEHQAKIIALRITVDETNPDPQFETGPVATFRLNGMSRQAQMASASGQNVRSTISGTATTTSDRSSVENVFMGVKEWSVWGKIEAPDKSELKQVAPGVIAVALAQMAAGELTPEEAATLQAQLEFLAAEGALPPELADIVRSIETMRAGLEGGMAPDSAVMQSLAKNIAELITQGAENGNLSPELARQVMESVAAFSETHGLGQVFSAGMMQSVSATIEWTAVAQALEQIFPHLSAADRTTIHAMMESGEVPSAEALAEQLAVINEIIAQADLPESVAAHVATVEDSSAVLQEIAQSQIEAQALDAPAASVDLAALSVGDVQAMIQALGDLDPAALTPEQAEILQALQEAMGTVDLANITPAQIEAALKGEGDPAISEALQAMAATLSQPVMAVLLPPDVQASMAAAVISSEARVDLAALNSAEIVQMAAVIGDMDSAALTPEQAEILQALQETLGTVDLANIPPEQIEAALNGEGGPPLPETPSSVAEGIDAVQAALEGGDNVIAFPVDAAAPPSDIITDAPAVDPDLSNLVPDSVPDTDLDGTPDGEPDVMPDVVPTGGPEIIADPVPDVGPIGGPEIITDPVPDSPVPPEAPPEPVDLGPEDVPPPLGDEPKPPVPEEDKQPQPEPKPDEPPKPENKGPDQKPEPDRQPDQPDQPVFEKKDGCGPECPCPDSFKKAAGNPDEMHRLATLKAEETLKSFIEKPAGEIQRLDSGYELIKRDDGKVELKTPEGNQVFTSPEELKEKLTESIIEIEEFNNKYADKQADVVDGGFEGPDQEWSSPSSDSLSGDFNSQQSGFADGKDANGPVDSNLFEGGPWQDWKP